MNNFVVKITSDIELWNLVRYLNVLRSRQHWITKTSISFGIPSHTKLYLEQGLGRRGWVSAG